jgi:hypothetical protein
MIPGMSADYLPARAPDPATFEWQPVATADMMIKHMYEKVEWLPGSYRAKASPDNGSIKIIVFWLDEDGQAYYRLLDKPPQLLARREQP